MYYFDNEGYMAAEGTWIDLPKTDKKIGWEQQEDGKWKYKDEKGYYINKWLVDPKTNYEYHFGNDDIECDMVIPAKGTEIVYFSAPDLHAVNFNHETTMIRVDITMADGEFWFEVPIYDINKFEDVKLTTFYIEP